MRVYAIAHNTFREAVRDKVLYVLLFLAGAAILGSKALGWISVGQDIKIMKDFSLASIQVFGVLIAIFVGTSLVYKEIDKRTLYTIVSRPIRRYEFIVGKYLGMAALLLVVTVAMAAVATLYVLALGGGLTASFYWAAVLIYAELLLLTAFAVLMSSLTTPILGAFVVLSCFLFGHATGILTDLPKPLEESAARPILQALYYIVPNLDHFNIRAEAANGVAVSTIYCLWALAYGAAYTAMMLILAVLAFEGKDV